MHILMGLEVCQNNVRSGGGGARINEMTFKHCKTPAGKTCYD